MKKTLIVIVALFIMATGLFLFRRYGNIAPAILPPATNNNQQSTTGSSKLQGDPLEFPLTVTQGMDVSLFAKNLGPARDLQFSPEGTLLVSITREGKILALPDRNKDGRADQIKEILTELNNPHGLTFHKGKLFVAEETRVVRYHFDEQNITATQDKVLFSLPSGGRHFTRSLVFDNSGNLYVSIGSTCDVCFEKDSMISTVVISDADGKAPRIFSKGLRNAVFITMNEQTNKPWVTEMGRDFLGDEVPPDEVNILHEGGDYGWPVCYGDRVYDKNFNQRTPAYCQNTVAPVYKIPAHSAPLGLTFVNSSQFPADWQGDLLVAYHGSWNRSTPTGYKVVRMNVEGERITGEEDFITGFLQGAQTAGRPADLTFDKEGNLFVSDDKTGSIYLINR